MLRVKKVFPPGREPKFVSCNGCAKKFEPGFTEIDFRVSDGSISHVMYLCPDCTSKLIENLEG